MLDIFILVDAWSGNTACWSLFRNGNNVCADCSTKLDIVKGYDS